jgi:hypothetical protein
MEPSSFTSHPKKGVLRIFIALKNPSPRPDLNPRPLGPVESTLTTTPPRRPIAIFNAVVMIVGVVTRLCQYMTYRPQSQDIYGNW